MVVYRVTIIDESDWNYVGKNRKVEVDKINSDPYFEVLCDLDHCIIFETKIHPTDVKGRIKALGVDQDVMYYQADNEMFMYRLIE